MAETLKAIKSKRTVRRGRLTTHKRLLDDFSSRDLRHIELSALQKLRKAMRKDIDIHEELQTRYEELLIEEDESEDQTAHTDEVASGAEYQDAYEEHLSTIDTLLENYKLHKEATRLEKAFEEWAKVADPGAKTFLDEGKEFITKIHDYLERTEGTASDLIGGGRTQLESLTGRIHKMVHTVREKATTSKDSSSTPTSSHRSKFDIDLPKFSGNPIEWASFHSLFTTTIDNGGKHLTSQERSCLLLKSLADPKAKELALIYTASDDGYQSAMDALAQRYRHPQVVLPLHIKKFKEDKLFKFKRSSLTELCMHHYNRYESAKKMDINLSTLWSAYAVSQFDTQLAEEWSKHTTTLANLPTMEDLHAYITALICRLPDDEDSNSSHTLATSSTSKSTKSIPLQVKTETRPRPAKCSLCNEASHPLAKCNVFKDYTPERRWKVVRDWRWCTNCLHHSHTNQHCSSSFTCRLCSAKHHTLLHKGDSSFQATSNSAPTMVSTISKATSVTSPETDQGLQPPTHAFLNTAMVKAINGARSRNSRIALDSGSSTSLITEALASQLKLRRYPQRLTLEGAYAGGTSKHYVQATLHSLHDHSNSITLKLSVVSKLPYATPPSRTHDIASDGNIKDLLLADNQFGGRLDILLGSLDVCKCLQGSFKYFPVPDIAVSPTIFGWTVTGPLDAGQCSKFLSIQTNRDDLEDSLQRLWELEQVPTTHNHTTSEASALQQFQDSHKVTNSGRYKVSLPRVASPPELGESKPMALSRFFQNEKSLDKKNKLSEFNASLLEYQTLGHAEVVPAADISKPAYYLPVHGVFKSQSTTTKVRPVFDASAKTTSGFSLNDLLLAGPNLYPLLTDILVQFRRHVIGFSADISKMFREILLNEDERDLHRFLMRDSTGAVKDFRMKRLTFGVKSSPFLATKVLHDITENHATTHPTASRAILSHFYVDDFLSGSHTLQEATHVRKELCELLNLAGMTLRKWRTSSQEFAAYIPEELRESDVLTVSETPKALGIHWDTHSDSLNISTPTISSYKKTTKRLIASLAAQVFDLLGLFSPFTIRSKLLLQQLWRDGLDWDEEVPQAIHDSWTTWVEELPSIHNHQVPRRYDSHSDLPTHRSLHGFSDASTLAYGAVVYLRQCFSDGSITSTIVLSKARVAPVKSITIPRAELVAAHLLAKLLYYTANLLEIPLSQVHAWTDSTIVLCWLRKLPSTLQTFVANRIGFIQSTLPEVPWRHVPSSDNPADLLSRGVSSSTLSDSLLWWVGPPRLTLTPNHWTPQDHLAKALPRSLPEQKAVVLSISPTSVDSNDFDLWSRFSSYLKLTRVLAWVKRFTNNSRSKAKDRITAKLLTSQELNISRTFLLKKSQRDSFPEILNLLKKNKALPKTHPLAGLNVSLTDDNVITVSGRVRQGSSKQPRQVTALTLKSSLTRLWISSMHRQTNHPGVSTLLAILTEGYYITGLKNFLKKVSRSCAVCQKAYARTSKPPMGLLPTDRTTPSPPFQVTGLDFAGPVTLRQGYTRKPIYIKSYICIFVCFATKASHLELCADLSTDAFLAALQRFCARRGTPNRIHSDNGTNFVGAAAEMRKTQQLIHSSKDRLSSFCHTASIEWHFIPPRAPNFGGLWEAGVRQMKVLLRKQVGHHPLRFEELTTVLSEVEAILNSRPITPLDSTELTQDLVLTPGHFLIGRPLKTPARPCSQNSKIGSLKRWNLVQRLQQDLWLAWQGWYLQTLMKRTKSHQSSHQFQIGDVILLKDEAFSSTHQWPMAKILQLFYGDDGIARAADVLCRGKTYRRTVGRFISLFSTHAQDT